MHQLQELLQEGPSGTGTSITILTRGLEDVSFMISKRKIEDKECTLLFAKYRTRKCKFVKQFSNQLQKIGCLFSLQHLDDWDRDKDIIDMRSHLLIVEISLRVLQRHSFLIQRRLLAYPYKDSRTRGSCRRVEQECVIGHEGSFGRGLNDLERQTSCGI